MSTQQNKDTNFNILPTQQTWFAFTPAIPILEIFRHINLGSESILLLNAINIYEQVNRPRKLL